MANCAGPFLRIPGVFPTDVPAAALPPPSKDGSRTFLLVGVDSRSDLPTTGRRPVKDAQAPEWRPGARRSDTMSAYVATHTLDALGDKVS